jgi:hypothetical protein
MGNNSSKWDREAYYRAMTMRQLEEKRDWWRVQLKKHDYASGREELAHIELLIGERIGKKRTN